MELCDCRHAEALCDRCVSAGFAQLRGVAASRGHWGVDAVIARTASCEPWPDTPKARVWARRRVADLTRDARLLELLADEVTRYAAKRWVAVITPVVTAATRVRVT